MMSLQGRFLVAAPHQLDPNFSEAVILVVQHADRGALGVMVNRPRDRQEVISRQRSTRPRWPAGPRLYFGGPVTGPRMAVHTDELFSEIEVLPGVFFAGRKKNVLALTRSRERPCKLFTGYAGWGPGQLEHEVEHGIWRATAATAAEIFSSGDNLWERLLRQAYGSLLAVMCNIKHIPSNASLN
ncbi:MAG: YqgE/AlgH family protein [Thermoguttaceae bacterium]|jgi:putative transcriptional regulator